MYIPSLVPRPFERGGGKGLGTTACTCAKYSDYFMYNTPYTSNNDVIDY